MYRLGKLISGVLFLVARSRLGGMVVGWSFAHMSSLIPVDRLYETENVVAFHHPKPSHPTHVLIVPKKAIPNLLAVRDDDEHYLLDVVSAAQYVVKLLGLEEPGYRLTVNGGRYQDVKQLHFHLVSEKAPIDRDSDDTSANAP